MDLFCYLCFMFVCHTVLSVPCSIVIACWEMADPLALLYVMFSCALPLSHYDVLGKVWYLIVLFPGASLQKLLF